jgi:hypothetical protein
VLRVLALDGQPSEFHPEAEVELAEDLRKWKATVCALMNISAVT